MLLFLSPNKHETKGKLALPLLKAFISRRKGRGKTKECRGNKNEQKTRTYQRRLSQVVGWRKKETDQIVCQREISQVVDAPKNREKQSGLNEAWMSKTAQYTNEELLKSWEGGKPLEDEPNIIKTQNYKQEIALSSTYLEGCLCTGMRVSEGRFGGDDLASEGWGWRITGASTHYGLNEKRKENTAMIIW